MPHQTSSIVTHSGAFHSDELMAIALLHQFFLLRPTRLAWGLTARQAGSVIEGKHHPSISPEWTPDGVEDCRTPCPILRTRDAALLHKAKRNKGVFVLDVGGEHNESVRNFDHHQESMQETWKDGTPYSCAGLIWKWLRKSGHVSETLLSSQEADELELALIRPLDAHDNGLEIFPCAVACEGFNRNGVDEDEEALQFTKALRFMEEVLENAIYQAKTKVKARAQLSWAWRNSGEARRYLVLEDRLDYPDGTGLLKEITGGRALLLGIPGRSGHFNLISTSLGSRFETACPVPEEWRGRMDFQVQDTQGPLNLAFAHKTGFMCIVEGDKAEAERVAELITRPQKGPGP